MRSTIYLAWVSGAGKTTTVTKLWQDGIIPVFFSGEMKRLALSQWLIIAPEQVYTLHSDIRQKLEDTVRTELAQSSESGKTRIIDGHIIVEDGNGWYRETFNDIQACAIDHLIFILAEPLHVVQNRQIHWSRPMQSTISAITQVQQLSLERIDQLKYIYPAMQVDILHNTSNDIHALYTMVKQCIESNTTNSRSKTQ